VLPSKLINMLASGRPVVATAERGTGLAEEVEGCGLVVPPQDPIAFAAAIERLLDDREAYAAMARAARKRVMERWRGGVILDALAARLVAQSPEAEPGRRMRGSGAS